MLGVYSQTAGESLVNTMGSPTIAQLAFIRWSTPWVRSKSMARG